MKIKLLSLTALIVASLMGCHQSPSFDDIFTKKNMDAYYYSASNIKHVETYYRKDKLTSYPHISLKNFYNLLVQKDLRIEKIGNEKYQVTSANNEVAIIDTFNDTLDVDDYSNFISTSVYRQDGYSNYYYDGSPFLKVKSVTSDTKPIHKTIDFKKYNVDLYGTEDDIILPLVTASNLFTGPTMITCFYNTDHIYFLDPNDFNYETSMIISDQNYQEGILKLFNNGKRTKEQAEFNYGELCFLINTYYGLPGREYLHKELKETRDLDKVLLTKNEDTKKTRELLLSIDVVEYFAGMRMLASFLFDAGHTSIDKGVNALLTNYQVLAAKVDRYLVDNNLDPNNYRCSRNYDALYLQKLRSANASYGVLDNTSKVVGDTLIYRFDSFLFELFDWMRYYEDPIHNPVPDDYFSTLVETLNNYENNKDIKNFVLDVSLNPGGYADMVLAIIGLLSQKSVFNCYDTINEQYVTVEFDFDANFDGVFDEKDKEVKYHYNFGILASSCSFSCGNLLPMQAKDNGIIVLGDKTGGGACAVVDTITSEGFYVRLSCPNHIVNKKKEEIDFGIEPDVYLVNRSSSDVDFSNFYNLELISEEMNKFYGNKN